MAINIHKLPLSCARSSTLEWSLLCLGGAMSSSAPSCPKLQKLFLLNLPSAHPGLTAKVICSLGQELLNIPICGWYIYIYISYIRIIIIYEFLMLEWTIWNILSLDLSRSRSVISLWNSCRGAFPLDGQQLPRQVLATSAGAQRTAVGLPILWSRCWARTLPTTWDGRYCGIYHWVKVCEHLKNLQHGGNLHVWYEHILEVLEKWWFLRFDPANSQALWDLEALEALIARVQVPWKMGSQRPGPFRWQYMNNVNPG